MKAFLRIATIGLALALTVPAIAKDKDRGQGDWRQNDRHGHREHRAPSQGSYISNGRVIFVDPSSDIQRIGTRYDNRYRYDDRNRRYHSRSGNWDNGRRGPPPWAKGRDYRDYRYDRIVYIPYNDYRRYDLYEPRRGYRWMRDDGGHYLLVSIASGIISDILYRGGF